MNHRSLRNKAQESKKEDNIKAVNDVQAIMLSPKTPASCMVYKTKLQLHKFSLYCLEKGIVTNVVET